ncbi:MAG: Serine protease Do-like HtrB [Oscillospiraceae bacterium]|jgi:serine protease Do
MNDNGFDPNKEKDPWEYGDDQPDTENQQPAAQETNVPQEPKESFAGTENEENTPTDSQDKSSAASDTPHTQETSSEETSQGNDAGQSAPNYGQPPFPPYGQYGPTYGPGNYGAYGGQPYGPTYGQPGPPPYGQPNAGNYGGYGNQVGNQPGGQQYYDNPYGQPYWNYSYNGQYGKQPNSPVPPPKKTDTGLKVFLWVLGVLVVGLIVATAVYSIQIASKLPAEDSTSSSSSLSSAPSDSGEAPSASSEPIIGGVEGDGTNPDSAGITIEPHPTGEPLTATEVYKQVIQSVVGVQTAVDTDETSEGTGIIASSDGYILTNAHVINYSKTYPVKVVLHNNKSYEAKVVGYDKTSDIAVLKINATDLVAATFGSVDGMQVGDRVIAIGNPGGLSFAGSLTGGYISALDRTIEDYSENGMTYIQTDAAINPGNSGGPLVNLYGQVIGINSNKIVATGYEGMGFAIPVSRAKTIIDDLIAQGYVSGRTRLGIKAKTVEAMYSQLYGYPQGVLIVAIDPDSSLNDSGVVQGDIIIEADGTEIVDFDSLSAVLARHKPGDTISMKVYSTSLSETAGGGKAGTTREVEVTLLEDKGETQ